MHIKIATRKSALALWQAEEVARLLKRAHKDLSVELIKMTTTGDQLLQESLANKGGKGLFVKELERGLLDNKADIAVHSMKDVPIELPNDLHLPTILKREDTRDAFISNEFIKLASLPDNAIIGTSSSRRACQIKATYPSLRIKLLRGNVNTRLAKLDEGDYDAIILAAAGLNRLGLSRRIKSYLSTNDSLPAIGQGAIGIECRKGDKQIEPFIKSLNHENTNICVTAERAVSKALQGGCQLPIAGLAELNKSNLTLRALVGNPDGTHICASKKTGFKDNPEELGLLVANELLSQGAGKILATLS